MATTTADVTYGSSIDGALTTLKAKLVYPSSASNLPIVVVMHGWSQQVSDLTDSHMLTRFAEGVYYTLNDASGLFAAGEAITGSIAGDATVNIASATQLVPRSISAAFVVGEVVTGGTSHVTATIASIATNNLFCVYPEMRGRNSSDGTPDGGGREIQDIIDAIDYVLANYASETDASHIYAVGYSGGGGNVLSLTARYPDTFNAAVDFFGMCDYGHTPDQGWWYTNPFYRTSIQERLLGTPNTAPNAYRSRASILARRNYSGGHLYIYHDNEDSAVSVINSLRVVNALDALGYTNYTDSITGMPDEVRWHHESPQAGQNVILAEKNFLPVFTAKTWGAWQVPTSATMTVIGWLDTSRFTIWLGDGLSGYAGTLTYNMTTRVFTIRVPFAQTATLTLHGQTPSATVATTVNGVVYSASADGNGDVEYEITISPVSYSSPRGADARRVRLIPNQMWMG